MLIYMPVLKEDIYTMNPSDSQNLMTVRMWWDTLVMRMVMGILKQRKCVPVSDRSNSKSG